MHTYFEKAEMDNGTQDSRKFITQQEILYDPKGNIGGHIYKCGDQVTVNIIGNLKFELSYLEKLMPCSSLSINAPFSNIILNGKINAKGLIQIYCNAFKSKDKSFLSTKAMKIICEQRISLKGAIDVGHLDLDADHISLNRGLHIFTHGEFAEKRSVSLNAKSFHFESVKIETDMLRLYSQNQLILDPCLNIKAEMVQMSSANSDIACRSQIDCEEIHFNANQKAHICLQATVAAKKCVLNAKQIFLRGKISYSDY